jgi:AcrR family transcriptional regulator
MMNNEIIKDKDQTMIRLLDAFDKILIEEGFQSLGINNIAKTAGVSKVLIYRYYKDFNGLLEAYLERKAFWLSEGRIDLNALKKLDKSSIKILAINIYCNLYDNLIQNIEQQEIKRWELIECNEVIMRVSEKIEEPSVAMNKILAQILDISEDEISGILGIITGGIYYLILRKRSAKTFSGIELHEEKGKETIKNAITFIINKIIQ